MKILVITNMWPGSRVPWFGIFVAGRVAAYRRLGATVGVAGIDDPRSGLVRRIAKYLGLMARSLATGFRLRPDVIEAHYLVPTAAIGWIVATVMRRPLVLVAHGSDVLVEHPRVISRFVAFVVARACEVHANSDSTERAVRARFPRVRSVVVIPPGVEIAAFEGSRHAAGAGDGSVAFVGTLDHHKGVDLLLEAMAGVAPPAKLAIVGTGPKRHEYEELALRLGISDRVDFMGGLPPEAIPGFLRSADVFVLPSRREALGVAAIEALAAGTPIVVSSLEGPASIPDPESGTVVPVGDVAAISRAITGWLQRAGDPAVAEAARRRAQAYDADQLATFALDRLQRCMAPAGN
jgi:phosphatidylinositol alpha-1,6-mannosyltransferase